MVLKFYWNIARNTAFYAFFGDFVAEGPLIDGDENHVNIGGTVINGIGSGNFVAAKRGLYWRGIDSTDGKHYTILIQRDGYHVRRRGQHHIFGQ